MGVSLVDKEWIREHLPEEPRKGLLNWARSHCDGELGPDYLTWSKRRFPIYDMAYLMDNNTNPVRYEWAAECNCLSCGGEFRTEYVGDTLKMWVDDAGDWWGLDPIMGYPFDDDEGFENGYEVEVENQSSIQCQLCCTIAEPIKADKLYGGRMKQILVVSIETVGGYAAVMYWLVCRKIYPNLEQYSVIPRDAYVLDENGKIHRYSHKNGGGYTAETDSGKWRACQRTRDSLYVLYHDWGSINNRKCGGIFYDDVPDLVGTTGEKTGLSGFASVNGIHSLEYLKLWSNHRSIENLVNTGWVNLVAKIVDDIHSGGLADDVMAGVIDIEKSKPHEILGMRRSDMREIRNRGLQWSYGTQRLFRVISSANILDAKQFIVNYQDFGESGMLAFLDLHRLYGDRDIAKLKRYLQKQNMQPRELGILLDTRNAERLLAGNRELTQEELFPRNLIGTHERLTVTRELNIDPLKAAEFQIGFDAVVEKFGDLQWTDGELCVILPKSYVDLAREGAVLRHCVGGYSSQHISGRDTIFFVRHYRRPDRCYYTLDIDMRGRPHRVQLHGYGNERHGKNKEYRHSIPKKVLDFCDRWEQEVLMPWYYKNKNQKEGKTA